MNDRWKPKIVPADLRVLVPGVGLKRYGDLTDADRAALAAVYAPKPVQGKRNRNQYRGERR